MGGFCYTAFVSDVCTKKIVGWACLTDQVERESAAGIQYCCVAVELRSLRIAASFRSRIGGRIPPIAGYTDRPAGLGVTPSVGSRGDSYTAPSARPPTFREAAMIIPKAFVKAIPSRSGVVQASARWVSL
jgi:hypothetical protein